LFTSSLSFRNSPRKSLEKFAPLGCGNKMCTLMLKFKGDFLVSSSDGEVDITLGGALWIVQFPRRCVAKAVL